MENTPPNPPDLFAMFGEDPPSPVPSNGTTTSESNESTLSSVYNAPTIFDSPTSTSSIQILNISIDSSETSEIGHMIIHEDPASPNDDRSGVSSHVSECGDDEDNSVGQMNVDEPGVIYRTYAGRNILRRNAIPRAFEQDIDSQEIVHSEDKK